MPDSLWASQEALILPDEFLTNPYFGPAAYMLQGFEPRAFQQSGQEFDDQHVLHHSLDSTEPMIYLDGDDEDTHCYSSGASYHDDAQMRHEEAPLDGFPISNETHQDAWHTDNFNRHDFVNHSHAAADIESQPWQRDDRRHSLHTLSVWPSTSMDDQATLGAPLSFGKERFSMSTSQDRSTPMPFQAINDSARYAARLHLPSEPLIGSHKGPPKEPPSDDLKTPRWLSYEASQLMVDPPEVDMNPLSAGLLPQRQEIKQPENLYLPRWVLGYGKDREAWCGCGRWLSLKRSTYWYHKNFTHGISVKGTRFPMPAQTLSLIHI